MLAELKIQQRPYLTTPTYQETISDGSYGYTVTALNQYGFESLSSNTASVASGDIQAPEPVILNADVTGSDVLLSWTASSSDDVIRYDIYRDDGKIAEHS